MKYVATLVAAAATLALPAAHAEPMHQHDAGEKPAAAASYAPGLGEIMSLQQMRHSKLWFAARARNWALADYELDELKEGFEDVATLFPAVNGVALPPVVDAIRENELAELAKAVQAQDLGAFARGFDRLTAACNACHLTTQHGFIAIRRPTGLPYTNQTFAPARRGRSSADDSHHHH